MPLVNLQAAGETIWFKTTGSGPPLLQIHGSAFGHRNFEKMTPLMAEHFAVIDFDLPGYGESQGRPRDSMEGIADQVFEFMHAAGLGKVNLHGTSFGAMIGLTLAARHPEVIEHLVLSCFLARYDNAARQMRATWKRAALESGMEAVADLTSVAGFARGFYDRPGAEAQLAAMRVAFSKNTPQAFIAGTETIERTDLSAYAPQVTAPTLLLAGQEDNMTPFKPADSGVGFSQIETLMPTARLTVLPECGHYLVIEQPELAAEAIVAFIGR
ncbi:alpha/beta fold hydrolase [Phenylobacterium sp.]|uniref:alpha/beta fold hydrolase n=1 Tax=Phenylobacterium sp. TaxID=1871053 RepID=UPI0025F0A9A5|nr:alpha/beta fold hydrolase [Phenylobacterium sp.]